MSLKELEMAKQRNYVAKYMNTICKNAVHKDKRHEQKLGKSKHKVNFKNGRNDHF